MMDDLQVRQEKINFLYLLSVRGPMLTQVFPDSWSWCRMTGNSRPIAVSRRSSNS